MRRKLVAMLLLLAPACGGGDDDDAVATTPPPTDAVVTTAPATTAATTTAAPTTAPATTTTEATTTTAAPTTTLSIEDQALAHVRAAGYPTANAETVESIVFFCDLYDRRPRAAQTRTDTQHLIDLLTTGFDILCPRNVALVPDTPAPPTTVSPALGVDLLNDGRLSAVVEYLEENLILERVDVIRVDGVDDLAVLVLEGSSGYATTEYQDEQVWEAVAGLAELLWSDDMIRQIRNINLGLALTVDGRRFEADEALMTQVFERSVSRPDWFARAQR